MKGNLYSFYSDNSEPGYFFFLLKRNNMVMSSRWQFLTLVPLAEKVTSNYSYTKKLC